MDINARLDVLCTRLGTDGWNYDPRIRIYPASGMAGRNLAETVIAALGHAAVVGAVKRATATEVIDDLNAGLGYAGDRTHYPNRAYSASPEFDVERRGVLALLRDLLTNAALVASFQLYEGHPFYPVYWDFAYLIERGPDAYVLIGSSSD